MGSQPGPGDSAAPAEQCVPPAAVQHPGTATHAREHSLASRYQFATDSGNSCGKAFSRQPARSAHVNDAGQTSTTGPSSALPRVYYNTRDPDDAESNVRLQFEHTAGALAAHRVRNNSAAETIRHA